MLKWDSGLSPISIRTGIGTPGCKVHGMEAEQRTRIESYRDLVLRWNRRIPLVSRRTPAESLDRLIFHSLEGAGALPREIKTVLDIGSGAGLPGIPIALSRRELEVLLFERSVKKQLFLKEAVRALALENARVRAEEFRPEGIGGQRPLAITALGLGNYARLARDVGTRLAPGDGMLLFIAENLAAEIAQVLGSGNWRWSKLEGSVKTGVAWIPRENRALP